MNLMKDSNRALFLWLAIVVGAVTPGCAASLATMTCMPGEPSVNCCLKKFPLSPLESCGVPAVDARNLLRVMEMAGQIAEADLPTEETEGAEGTEAQALPAAPEPPDCNGQEHHVISRRIARELERHENLRGLYEPRDERFKARAKDKDAHCGYQRWHRDVDEEVIAWLQRYRNATREEFETFLREIYSRSGLRERFPHGF